uniref:Uncharacterized protein n=1 Tax=Daphnia galeata TaxID=27404 RepID=A0A8J2RJT4_9CRUS|nr:unnamed protein product [Daphnia galeata]
MGMPYQSSVFPRFEMDRIIHDLANSSAHLNYTRFLDLIADHERNPNQHPHGNWSGHPPGEASAVGYELSAPKPGPSIVYPTSLTATDSLHAARSLALHDTSRNEASFKTLCFTELKSENAPSTCQPSTSRRVGVKSEPLENNSGTERTNPSKRIICGVCNLEMPETKFDDHRYAEHIGLARPYGMSQDFSDAEKRRELKRALLLMKQVSCPYCLRIFTSTLGFQYHQSRCEAEVGDSPKRQVDCYLCGKQVAAFRAHMKIHLKEERQQLVKMLEETKIISCHYCDSKYSTLTGYLYHKDRCRFAPHPPLAPLLKKSNKRKEECEVCGKKVLVLKSHMKLHERALAKTE